MIGLLASIFLASFAQASDLKDATGTTVHVSDHPSRVVTLAPSVAELTAEILGAELQRIVGVSTGTDYPPALAKVDSIGPYHRFNIEKIASLKPDLVLGTIQGNSKDQVLHLRELGLPVFVLGTADFAEIESSMEQVATLLGEPEKGPVLVERFKKSLDGIRERGSTRAGKHKRVLVQLDDSPVVVAGGSSFLNEELKTVGAENVYGDTKTGYPRPSVEDVLAKNPDFILVLAFGTDLKPFNRMAWRWTRYSQMAAVKANQIKVVYADALLRPSMRLLEGLAVLEKTLYGKN